MWRPPLQVVNEQANVPADTISQLRTLAAKGRVFAHGVQEVPQFATSFLATQVGGSPAVVPPHWCRSVSHAYVQAVPLQPTVPPPPMIATQGVQLVPHVAVALLLRHIGAAAVPPQLWAPVSHWMLHTPAAEHAGWDSEPAGWLAHGVQASPHWVTLCATQVPPQMC